MKTLLKEGGTTNRKKKIPLLFFLGTLSAFISCSNPTDEESEMLSEDLTDKGKPSPTFNLVYDEEFNGNAYDTNYWTSYQTQSWSSAWNHYVVPNDPILAEVKDGHLYMRARWNTETDLPETGAIQTLDKFSFTYGKIEVKAKFTSSGQGGWPAIWLMPQTPVFSGWPDGGEIDIMEHLNTDSFIYQVVHQSDSGGNHLSASQTTSIALNDYNTYGIVKTPGKIEFYVNDNLTMTHRASGKDSKKWPFDTDFYIILNYACADKGQSGMYFWPGNVTSTDGFPYEMAIDYLKVWELVE
ncbi:glycoside hydrolase family 16 protein [Snuella sedimenti]|uniref:Glycoside hydrolase family 16 protein n=1 Tax=Snuella sedimenti TaxID=2798802 RepID=A0A8J7IFS9_9FLAO|nr:glycoside hydrolase family 16 protein [Snuella sedimenti]MBJ6368267.1 glycoside hydrolase family 16 protein [Snuella sedimenti]